MPLSLQTKSVALTFLFGLTTTMQCRAQTNGLDVFYLQPSPLPAARHGKLIRSRPVSNSAALPSAGRNLLVLYHSTDEYGKDIAVTGVVSIPAGIPPADGWPVTTWTHGTTGIAVSCAPSLDSPNSPEHEFLGMHEVVMDDYVKRGYVVVATDYEGLSEGGKPGIQPFLQGASAAHTALDIIRAAREIDPHIGRRYVAIGHSQGGHADLFTAALGPMYLPELQLLGDVAIAPASHIAQTLQGMVLGDRPTYALAYAMYVLESFASNHSSIHLDKILTAEALAHLPLTMHSCITSSVSKGYWATAIPKKQFLPGADLTEVLTVATQNEPGSLKIIAPTFVAQGTVDTTVLPSWTDSVVQSLCKSGTPVQFNVYPGATHETVLTAASKPMRTWVEDRFAGRPSSSNCTNLPSAAVR